jgi:hypothetical protein
MPPPEAVEEVRVEQQIYARVLDRAAKAGFVILVAGFFAYALGWIPAHVPLERLPELWRLPLQDYLRATDTPTGWGWIVHLPKGEFASLAGIEILAGCSLVCLLAIIPVYARRGDRVYVAICVAEIAVLLLAASGVLTGIH